METKLKKLNALGSEKGYDLICAFWKILAQKMARRVLQKENKVLRLTLDSLVCLSSIHGFKTDFEENRNLKSDKTQQEWF